MTKNALAVLTALSLTAASTVIVASPAEASAKNCASTSYENYSWQTCISINGSGLYVNSITISVYKAGFPSQINCTVKPGFNGPGYDESSLQSYSCTSFASSSGYTFTLNRDVEAGNYCANLYFPAFGQSVGTHACIDVFA